MPPSLDFLIEVCSRRSSWARSALNNLQWYEAWADGTECSPQGIIVAHSWWDRDDDTLERVGRILERLGYTLAFEDSSIGCDHCYNAICTQPQHMWDYHHYHCFDGWIVCEGCILAGNDLDKYCEEIAQEGRIDRFGVDPTTVSPGWRYLAEIDLSGSVWDKIVPQLCKVLQCESKDLLVSENAIHARGAALRGYCRVGKIGLEKVLFWAGSLARSYR